MINSMKYDSKKRRARYLANRDKEIEQQKKRNRDRAPEVAEYQARYYAEHADEIRKRARERMRKARAKKKKRSTRAI